ncbi:MAG: Ig-like domain-containing protein [Clostridia bacterium]|nr:Ig-like domain-containing protein [Clostridia bacterium]
MKKRGTAIVTAFIMTAALFTGLTATAETQRIELVPFTSFDSAADGDKGNRGNANISEWKVESGDTATQKNEWVADGDGGYRKYSYPTATGTGNMMKSRRLMDGFDTLKGAGDYYVVMKARMAYTPNQIGGVYAEWGLAKGANAGDSNLRLMRIYRTSGGGSNYVEVMSHDGEGNTQKLTVASGQAYDTWNDTIIVLKATSGSSDATAAFFINGEKYSDNNGTPFKVGKNYLEQSTGPRASTSGGNILKFDDAQVYGISGDLPAFEVAAGGVNGGTLTDLPLADDITVQFSNEVYVGGLADKIKLYQTGESEQTVAKENIKVSPDQKSISISHNAFTSGGEYTLDLSGATDIFGTALSGTATYQLKAMEGFTVSGFNGGKTDKIGVTEDIGLQFSSEISPANLYGKLTIQKDGESALTVADEAIKADGTKGILITGNQFDVASSYTLSVADDVADNSGETIGAASDKAFSFTTRPAAFGTLYTDFSAMTKDAQPVNEPGFTFSEKGDTLRVRESDGKNYLEVRGITETTAKTDPNFRVTLPNPMGSYGDYQTISFKMKIAANAAGGANMRVRYCTDSGGTKNQMTMLGLRSGKIGVCDYAGSGKDQTDGTWIFADGVTYTVSMRTNFAAHCMDISITGDDGTNYSLQNVDIDYDKMHYASGTPTQAWTENANSIEFYFATNDKPIFADIYEVGMHDNFPDFKVTAVNDGATEGVGVNAAIPVTFSTPLRAEDLFGMVSLQKGEETPAVLTNAEIVQSGASGINIIPAAELAYGTVYKLILDAAAADCVGMKLSGTREFSFRTAYLPFTVSDFNGGVTSDIGRNANLTLTFSTPVTAAELANQITLQKQGGAAVNLDAARIVQNGANGITVTGNEFEASATYTLALKDTAVDSNGTAISGTKSFTFGTGAALAAFRISSFNAGKTTDIGWTDDISIVFTTEVNKANLSGKIKLQPQGGAAQSIADSRIVQNGASGITITGNTFDKAATYTVTVDATAVDNAGTVFSDTDTYTFTTKDEFTVQTFNGGTITEVELDGDITIAFSNNVDAANLANQITITKEGGAAETVPVARIAQVDAKTVKVTGNNFSPSATYTLELLESAKDNAETAISGMRSFQFTTKAAFLVESFNGGKTTNVSLSAAIPLQFSTAVDVGNLSGKITLQKGSGTAVTVADKDLSQIAANTVAVAHSAFDVESGYTLSIASSAKDNAGRSIQPPLAFAFTTQKEGMNRSTNFAGMAADTQPANGDGFTFSVKNSTIRVKQENGVKFMRVEPNSNDDPNFRVTAPQKFSAYSNKIVLYTKMKITAEENSGANMRMRYCIDNNGTKNQMTLLAIKDGKIGIGDYAGSSKDKTDGTWTYRKNATYDMTFVMDYGATPKMDVFIVGDDGSVFTLKNAGINYNDLMTAASGTPAESWVKDANSIEFYYGKSGTPISTNIYAITLREAGEAGYLSATPADGSNNVAPDSAVMMEYSDVINLVGAQARFVGSGGEMIPASLSLAGFGDTLVVRPQQSLYPGETYTLSVVGLTDMTGKALYPAQIIFTVKTMDYQAVAVGMANGQATLQLVNTTEEDKTMLILTAKCVGTPENYMVQEITEREEPVAKGTGGRELKLPADKGEASFVKIIVLDSDTHRPVMYVPAVVQ